MRIGINLLFLLPGEVGGTETYVRSLLEGIKEIDSDNQYIIFLNSETSAAGFPESDNFEFVDLPVKAGYRMLRYLAEQAGLPALTGKYNLDVLHSPGYVQPLMPNCPSVVTIHDLNYLNLSSHMGKVRRRVLQFFVRGSVKSSDHILTVSSFSKKQIVSEYGIEGDKVTVTHNAAAPVKEPSDFEEISGKFGLSKPYVFGLSGKSEHKNISSLVRAFSRVEGSFAGLQLVLAGHLPFDQGGTLKEVVEEEGVSEKVIFTGYVPSRDLAGLYENAEVFAFPSFYEGFGIPVLEAYIYDTPVICSEVASLPEVAGDGAVYFDPNRVDEIAEAIGEVVGSNSLKKSLIEKGKEQRKKFSWDKTARRTLGVYREVANK